jgi:activating signal cointegrator complex subunit 1
VVQKRLAPGLPNNHVLVHPTPTFYTTPRILMLTISPFKLDAFDSCLNRNATRKLYSNYCLGNIVYINCRPGFGHTPASRNRLHHNMAKNKGRSTTSGYKAGQSSGSKVPNQVKRPPLTHFLCIPLVTEISKPQFTTSIRQFQELVSNGSAPQGALVRPPLFSPKAVRPIGTIHFTLGVMSLLSEEKVDAAIELLKSLDLNSILLECLQDQNPEHEAPPGDKAEPLVLSLTSLVSMHAPNQTSVLYAIPQDSTERLYALCTKLRSLFETEGHLNHDDRPLKLHATIVNTIYAKTGGRGRPPRPKSESGPSKIVGTVADLSMNEGTGSIAEPLHVDTSAGHGPNARGSHRFDATALIEECKEFTWASDFRIEKLAICKMGAKKIIGPNGGIIGEEYEEVASIPMPTK